MPSTTSSSLYSVLPSYQMLPEHLRRTWYECMDSPKELDSSILQKHKYEPQSPVFQALTYRNGDNSLFANLLHSLCNELTNFPFTISWYSTHLWNRAINILSQKKRTNTEGCFLRIEGQEVPELFPQMCWSSWPCPLGLLPQNQQPSRYHVSDPLHSYQLPRTCIPQWILPLSEQ